MRRRSTFWAKLSLSLFLLGACLWFVDLTSLLTEVGRTDPILFMNALLLSAAGTILAKAWLALLTTRATGMRLAFWALVRINLVARFYTIILPRGASAAIRWHFYRAGGTGHSAAALLLFENLVSIATLFLLAAVFLSIVTPPMDVPSRVWLTISLCGIALTVGLLLPFLHTGVGRVAKRVLGNLIRRQGRFAQLADRLIDAMSMYSNASRLRLLSILAVSVIGHALFLIGGWVLALGLELDIAFAEIAWVRSATLLVALVPITIGGLGLREGAMIALLGAYGISATSAFAYAMASFAIQVLIGLIGGVLELFRVTRVRPGITRPDEER